jgi:RimJ/RimL family protein N-acetyltransferase
VTSAPLLEGFTVRPFEDRDAAPLQALFDADPEFFQGVNGRDIPVTEIRGAIPPGRTLADKFFFAILKEDRVAGLIDIIGGYPEPDTWHLGFIFLAKEVRGGGVGRRALHAIYDWMKGQGATTIRLGVVEPNTRARWLYASEGFVFKGVREIDLSVNRARRTLVLERPL